MDTAAIQKITEGGPALTDGPAASTAGTASHL
jgi:hypothetical protein